MDMKIKGYSLTVGSTTAVVWDKAYDGQGMKPTTLIIHPGPEHEEVFTKSEVEAMLLDVGKLCAENIGIEYGYQEVAAIAKKHGITL